MDCIWRCCVCAGQPSGGDEVINPLHGDAVFLIPSGAARAWGGWCLETLDIIWETLAETRSNTAICTHKLPLFIQGTYPVSRTEGLQVYYHGLGSMLIDSTVSWLDLPMEIKWDIQNWISFLNSSLVYLKHARCQLSTFGKLEWISS